MFIQNCGGKPGRDRERRKTEAKTTFQFVWTRRQYELEEIGSVKEVLLLIPIGFRAILVLRKLDDGGGQKGNCPLQ